MDKEEILQLLQEIQGAGVDFMLADTDVTLYECGVPCGVPSEIFDDLKSTMKLPASFFNNQPCIIISADGDSMIGAGINDGDQLLVRLTNCVNDGDVVFASCDNEYTVKTYFKDENDTCWLLPQNENYMPILLNENCEFRICGKVIKVIKENIKSSYSDCKKILRKSNASKTPRKEITLQVMKKAIDAISGEITVNRQWYAVFRVLIDRGRYGSIDAVTSFVDDVNAMFPDNDFKLNADDLSRMAVQSFRRSVAMWNPNDAPVKGKRFEDYLKIAREFDKKLG